MKKTFTNPLAWLAVCAVLAAAPSARAEAVELLADGEGSSLDGWTNSGFRLHVDANGVSWFGAGNTRCEMSQTVSLAEAGLAEAELASGVVLSASATVSAKWGRSVCRIEIEQLGADGEELGTSTLLDTVGKDELPETVFADRIALDPRARQVRWTMAGRDYRNWADIHGPLFRLCSLSYEREDPPAPARPETALDCSTIVYRGQLNLLGSDAPAADSKGYTKTMHFKVYDDAAADTPVWSLDDQTVQVNRDGSFTAVFGDEALAALIATGKVTHVGVAIGPGAAQAIELKPRRALRPVASVNRALMAEAAGKNPRVGNLVTENALKADDVVVSRLEVEGTVTAPGAAAVKVSPVVVGERETLTLLRGDGVQVFSREAPADLGAVKPALRGQALAVAPADGVALVSSSASGSRALRCPGAIQYCRKGESVRAPASDPDGLKVTFFPFIGQAKEGK